MVRVYLAAGYQPLDHVVPIARAAEELGFHGVGLPDHVFNPTAISSSYPASADGATPWDMESCPFADTWVALSAVAAATARLHVMSHVTVLPLRDPFLIAKSVATVATMFPGRVEFGIGVGWMREEFELLGSDFSTRGARTEEMIGVIQAIWNVQPASFQGAHYSFAAARMHPVPTVPILGSGTSRAAIDRAARLLDGFATMPGTVEELEHDIASLRDRLAAHGRSLNGFHINATTPVATPDDLDRLADLGVTSVQVHPFGRREAQHESIAAKVAIMSEFADDVGLTPIHEPAEGRTPR